MRSTTIVIWAMLSVWGLPLLLQAAADEASIPDLQSSFDAAVQSGDVETIRQQGEVLFERTNRLPPHQQLAGRVAYVLAEVSRLSGDTHNSPPWFDKCASNYGQVSAYAQQVDCLYRASIAYKAIGRYGTWRSRLQSAESVLEQAGATGTAVAANIFSELSESYRPNQFEVGAQATENRRRALKYASKARAALVASGDTQSFMFAMILAGEAIAYEDLEEYQAAYDSLEQAIRLCADMPEAAGLIDDLQRRFINLSIKTSKNSNPDRITVETLDGRRVELKIRKRARIRYPRTRNVSADYGFVRVIVSLDDNGGVAIVDVAESQPSPEFGEAVRKAVAKWTFTPVDETLPANILPFEYSISFTLERVR